jgi:hypothetical protein
MSVDERGELGLDVVANHDQGETYRALRDYPRAIDFMRKSIERLQGENITSILVWPISPLYALASTWLHAWLRWERSGRGWLP